jgi:hypothetical protein
MQAIDSGQDPENDTQQHKQVGTTPSEEVCVASVPVGRGFVSQMKSVVERFHRHCCEDSSATHHQICFSSVQVSKAVPAHMVFDNGEEFLSSSIAVLLADLVTASEDGSSE